MATILEQLENNNTNNKQKNKTKQNKTTQQNKTKQNKKKKKKKKKKTFYDTDFKAWKRKCQAVSCHSSYDLTNQDRAGKEWRESVMTASTCWWTEREREAGVMDAVFDTDEGYS